MRRFLLPFLGGLAASLAALPGLGQTLDASFATPGSLARTVGVEVLGPAQADGKRLVGGYATRANGTPITSGLLRLDATGALDMAFLQNVGAADVPYRIKGLANGQYLLEAQANSLVAGGLTRNELLRLNANGTADPGFDAGTGPETASGVGYSEDVVEQPDGKLLVSGSFDTFNGATAHSLVRLNANGSVDGSFSVGAGVGTSGSSFGDLMVLALQPDGKILVGGVFSAFNNQPANSLVRLNANGSLDPTFTSPLGFRDFVYSLTVQPDGNIVVTGRLTQGGITSVVRLLPSGGFDPGFALAPAVGNTVYSEYQEPPLLLQPDGKMVIIGSFDLPGYRQVARLNPDGSLDVTFQVPAGPGATPTTLGLQPGGNILVGGNFGTGSNAETSLAQLTSAGALDTGYLPRLQVAGSIELLAQQADGTVLVAGNFSEWDGLPAHQLVRLSAAGAPDAAYVAASSVLPGVITALLVQADGKAVVGTSSGLYRRLPSGATDPGFARFAPSTLYATVLAQQTDGKLLVGGQTNGLGGGAAYNRLARLNTNGSFDATFAAPVSPVGAIGLPSALLVQQDGRILLAANSSQQGLTNVAYLLRYESTGATDSGWPVPSFTYASSTGTAGQARVSALAQQPDGNLLAGGRFTRTGSFSQNHLVRLASSGAVDASFAPGTLLSNSGVVTTLAVQPNGRLLLGGLFSAAGPAGTYANLLRLSGTGQLDPTFTNAANPNNQLRTLAVQPDGGILLQGYFTSVAGQPRLSIARITAPNVLAVQAPAAVAAATTAWPVPAHEQLHVQPAAGAHPQQAELLDALGRVVQQRPLTDAQEFMLDVRGLPAGLYVLRLRYQEGTVSRRLAVE